jgi:CheY-like chemotaxis protein
MSVLIVAREQAALYRVQSLLRRGGINATTTTNDDEAIGQMESGADSAVVVGGGVEERSRRRIRSVADSKGISVIDGALRGKDPEVYVRDELLPALRRVIK